MVIAALVSFGILLAVWIGAPTGERRADATQSGREIEVLAEGVARAA